ncbi:mono/diheme cytochrome c family protein [Pedobacter africanus]|uniref:Mono/diheme cytochrome c family protein n=1 Tax=Pedobacter africanus TaxID=151894 RepID=A0ACC6KRF1_9SPHI|nr:cytochrome c [Pedobacter africanus]MDR6781733.1 mono/diheme cytochrome c family protein [Pedobacter africanus]
MRRYFIGTLFLLSIGLVVFSCQDAAQVKQDVYYVNGRDLYIRHCQNCHGTDGEGLGTLTPPLTDTIFLKQNRQKLACFIKNGIKEPITVGGQVYEGTMPDFASLHNIDIAQLLVYISNSFGNKQGMYTQEEVEAALKKCK